MPDPIKWYVNLPAVEGEQQGKEVLLVAERDGGAAKKKGGAPKKVKWKLEHDAKATHGLFASFEPELELEESVETLDHKFKNKLILPPTGGVTYTVKATKSTWSRNVNTERNYITWRKLKVTVNYMSTASLAPFEAVEETIKNHFKPAFIDLEFIKVAAKDIDPAANGGLGTEVRTVSDTRDITLSARHAGSIAEPAGRHVRAVLCNDIGDMVNGDALDATVEGGVSSSPDLLVRLEQTRLEFHTRKKQDHINRHFKVTELTLKPDAFIPLAAESCVKTGDACFTVQLTREQAELFRARGGELHVKLKGREATIFEEAINQGLARAQDEANPQGVGRPQCAKMWIAGDKLNLKLLGDDSAWGAPLFRSDAAVFTLDALRPRGAVTRVNDTTLSLDVAQYEPDQLVELNAGKNIRLGGNPRVVKKKKPVAAERAFRVRLNSDSAGAHCKLIGGDKLEVYSPYLLDAENAFKEPKLQIDGALITLTGEQRAAVAQVPADNAKTEDLVFALDLDVGHLQPVLAELRAGGSIRATLKYEWFKSKGGYYTEKGGGNDRKTFVLTSVRFGDEKAAVTRNRMLFAFCHELAHALKAVLPKEDRRTGEGKNKLCYEGHGGLGSHCSHNVADLQARDYEPRQPLPPGTKLCIMHHAIYPELECEFCETCRGQLTRLPVVVPPLG
jgi:hypothetical protein